MTAIETHALPGLDELPLCVDLDGTLVYGDMLAEGMLSLSADPGLALAIARLPFTGRAAFKAHVGSRHEFDPAYLPYNEPLLDYLRAQKALGRYLVLATAAHERVANAIAAHLGLFDEVIASDSTRNLKGRAKGAALCARFGEHGFAYAGNDASDLAVWKVAGAAIPVNASARVARRAADLGLVETVMPGSGAPAALTLLKAMRPHQWVKNLLVFVPIFTAHAMGELHAWVAALLLFAAFCATTSGIYLVNDATDIAADRRHPRKRKRPFASGALPVPVGMAASPTLLTAGAGLAVASGAPWVILGYAAMSISYSVKLKEQPLVDVFMLAGLYTIRLFGGGVVTGHELSLWLLGFSAFLFLGLAILKRVAELMSVSKENRGQSAARRGYGVSDLPMLQMMGCGSSFASAVVLALFVQSDATASHYASPVLLWAAVPLLLFWQCRLWLSTARGYMLDDPIVYSAKDWVSWLAGGAVMALLLAAYSIKI